MDNLIREVQEIKDSLHFTQWETDDTKSTLRDYEHHVKILTESSSESGPEGTRTRKRAQESKSAGMKKYRDRMDATMQNIWQILERLDDDMRRNNERWWYLVPKDEEGRDVLRSSGREKQRAVALLGGRQWAQEVRARHSRHTTGPLLYRRCEKKNGQTRSGGHYDGYDANDESSSGEGKESSEPGTSVTQLDDEEEEEEKEEEQGPQDQQEVEQEAVEQEPVEQEPVEQEAVEQEAVEQEAVEQEPVEQEAVEQEAVEQEAVEQEPQDQQEAEESCHLEVEEQAPEEEEEEEEQEASGQSWHLVLETPEGMKHADPIADEGGSRRLSVGSSLRLIILE
ncbi:sperm acrosomal protein FSA-ACR.1-like [Branchiostoma lanceolatum]|uniref:sperm acrosomal protein FSA-ACR.1-like n=1 Tax=Branchiostoma lanceolatum TaxID=7740 RepID=UPI0034563808